MLGFEALKDDGRHLAVRSPFSLQDDTFSMCSSQLRDKPLLSDLRPHWFWKTIFEREVSRRDLIGGALQHIMECNVFLPFSQEKIEDGGHIRIDKISHACVGHSLNHTHHDGMLDRKSVV